MGAETNIRIPVWQQECVWNHAAHVFRRLVGRAGIRSVFGEREARLLGRAGGCEAIGGVVRRRRPRVVLDCCHCMCVCVCVCACVVEESLELEA